MASVSQTRPNGRPRELLQYLPQQGKLKSGKSVIFDQYKESDIEPLHSIFKQVIEDCQTYPHETMESVDEFKAYFLSYEAFVVRDAETSQVLGSFYVKPQYPGRSSHICNTGFIVSEAARGQGVATYMVPRFLRVAGDLGFKSIMFLVYVTDEASIKLWDSFSFKRIGLVPQAGNLKGFGYVDGVQYYYDISKVPKSVLDYLKTNG